jgi:hypothetical protein
VPDWYESDVFPGSEAATSLTFLMIMHTSFDNVMMASIGSHKLQQLQCLLLQQFWLI